MFLNIILFLIILLLFPSIALSNGGYFSKKNKFKLGAGIYIKGNNRVNNLEKYGDKDTAILPYPALSISVGAVKVQSDRLCIRLVRTLPFSFEMRLKYSGDSYLGEGMAKRHKSFFAGAALRLLMFKFQYYTDVQKRSKGSIYKVGIVIPFQFNKNTYLAFQVKEEFWDKKYTNYYFGISENEATDSRASYYINKYEYSFYFQGTFYFPVAKSIHMEITSSMRKYGRRIKHSPTVGHHRLYSGRLTLLFNF